MKNPWSKFQTTVRVRLSFALIPALLLVIEWKATSQNMTIPVTTSDRVLSKGWWPTKGTENRDQYLGPAACASCHRQIVETQRATAMAHALTPGGEDRSGASGPLSFQLGIFKYAISQTTGGLTYSADDGIRSVSANPGWVFGSGHFGQTYVYQDKGVLYESNLSYFSGIHGLDFTTGHKRSAPADLEKALGVAQPPDTIRGCFGCHSTASTTSGRFDPAKLIPGVTCEACHGPGAQHVAAMSLGGGDHSNTFITNPASLSPPDSVDFCGACHRTRLDTEEMRMPGVLSIRFPAYRLQASRCWGADGDRRLTCMACHNPHFPLASDPVSYDRNCLSCHVTSPNLKPTSDHPGNGCPVAQKECTSCHMPKYEITEMHADFTDHKIAIHHPGDSFTE